MKRLFTAILSVVAITGFTQVATAQYMYLDSNANGIHDPGDVLNANGIPRTVDVWVNTNHNRDGSEAVCNTQDGVLQINSYAVNLIAQGGTVTYSGYINQQPTWSVGFGEVNAGDGQYKNGGGGAASAALPPGGPYRLMTITIMGTAGSPSIIINDLNSNSPDFTSFGTACSGNDFDNTYKLSGPGGGSDWTDVDGLGAAGGASPPVLAPIGNKSGAVGSCIPQPVTFTATATDPDVGQTLTFSLGPGAPAGATIHPSTGAFSWQPTTPGVFPVTVVVTDDGLPPLSDSETIQISIAVVNAPPVLNAVGNKTVNEGSLLTFVATAVDFCDEPLFFTLGSGAPAGASITLGGTPNTASGTFTWTPSETQGPGIYPVTIIVTRGSGGSDSETIQITVNEVNEAPILSPIGNKGGSVGVPLTFTATATDTDIPAQTLTFSLGAGAPPGATINASTGAFSWTPTGCGTFPVTIIVTDNGTPTRSDSEAIAIELGCPPNFPPTLAVIGSKTVDEGSLLSFTATATDPDIPPQTLTFSLGAGAPPGAAITVGGNFTWTPTEAQSPSVRTITVIVTDNGTGNLADSETIQVTVNEVNQAPVLAAIGNKIVEQNHLLTFTATATDADLPAQTLTFSLGAGAPAGATIGGASGVFSWMAPLAFGTTHPVTIIVTDNGTPPLNDTETISIFVAQDHNQPPVLGPIGNRTVNEGSLLSFTATANDVDMGTIWTFSLEAGAPAGAAITSGGAFTWTPTEAQGPGVYPITVRVTDEESAFDNETIQVTVNEVNVAPILAVIGNKTVNELALLSFTATAADVDVPANTLSFSLGAGAPAGASITAGGNFTWTPTEPQGPGSFSITVIVTDNGVPALNDTEAITVTVNEVNVAPILAAIGNKTAVIGLPLTFTASATDADIPANTLTFTLGAGAPAGATMNPFGAFSWTPTASGTFPITVIVTDNGSPSLSDLETIQVVIGSETPPVLAPIGNKTVDEGSLLTFTATATSSSGFPIVFSLGPGLPSGASINPSTGVFTWTPNEFQGPGIFPITVRATENGGPNLSDSETIQVTVREINTFAPVLAAIGNKTVTEGQVLAFTATATDGDVPTTFTFSLGAGNPLGSSITAGGNFTWTPTEMQGGSSYPVTVIVSDNGVPSLLDTEMLLITVNENNIAPVLAAIGPKTATEGILLSFSLIATDADLPPQLLTFSFGGVAPAGAAIFPDNTFRWTPSETQGGAVYPVTIVVTDNGVPPLSDSEIVPITVLQGNTTPVLAQPSDMTVDEGQTATQQLTASDPDVPTTLAFSKVSGPLFLTVSTAGLVTVSPVTGDAGTHSATVRVTDGFATDTKSFLVTVISVNVTPLADANGPYSGVAGVDITFDGSGSADPNGNPLTYIWDFGDGTAGSGVNPTHAYAVGGNYIVTLTVDDGVLSDTDATAAIISQFFSTVVFVTGGNKTIRLGSGKPQTCVQIEPVNDAYALSDVDLGSLRMGFGSNEISAISGKTTVGDDKNQNGVTEITACFSKESLRVLFAGTPTGDYDVALRGDLITGGTFEGSMTLHVVNNGSFLAATISPNPLNPKATMSFVTSKPGAVRIRMFDVQGRLIRTLMDESAASAGYHDVEIDGHDANGRRLASGIYYLKVVTSTDGELTKAVTILK